MGKSALLPVGTIVGTHGVRGHLKVFSYADSIECFAPGKELVLRRKGEPLCTRRVASSRLHKRLILLTLDGVGSIETAKEWVGYQVCIEKTCLPPPEEGSYYWHQIIGLEVFNLDNRRLGCVEAILPTGSNDVYVVRDGVKEILIPAINSVVVDIDLKEKRLRVDLPEGLEN